MQKFSFGLKPSFKISLLMLIISSFAFATMAIKPTKVTQAATSIMQHTAVMAKSVIASLPLGAPPMQATTCAAPPLQKGTNITVNSGLIDNFVVGDFNNDQKTDIAIQLILPPAGGNSTNELRTLLGNGSGGFTPNGAALSVVYATLIPNSAADYNGDGKQDVLMFDNNLAGTAQKVNIVTANASGVLSTVAESFSYVNSDQYGRAEVKAGDFNNDGKADFTLSTLCCPETNSVYLSNPNGTHTKISVNWSNTGASKVASVGDFNGDGNLDVITSDNYYPALTARLGNGKGQFTNGELLFGGTYFYLMGVLDVNKDGRVDLFGFHGTSLSGVNNATTNTPAFLSSDSTGHFTPYFMGIAGTPQFPAIAADFNGDGAVDFIDATTSFFMNNGTGFFCQTTPLISGAATDSLRVTKDINGDGKADVLSLNSGLDTKIEIWTSGSGTTNTPPTIVAAAPLTAQRGQLGFTATIATVSDAQTPAGSLTVTATTVPAGITVTGISNNNGTISATIPISCSATIGPNLIELTVTDANGASAKANLTVNVQERTGDLIFRSVPNSITIPVGLGVQYLLQLESAAFPTAQISAGFLGTVNPAYGGRNNMAPFGAGPLLRIANAGPVGSYTLTLTATTLCGNTVTKSVTVNVTGETAACPFPKYGTSIINPFAGISNTEVGDFNKDGKLDLAVAYTQPANTLGILLGDGRGGFAAPKSYEAGKVNGTLHGGDFNGDTYPDLLVSVGGTNWTLLFNDKAGGFTAVAKPASAQNIAFNSERYADVNKDGKMDVLVTSGAITAYLSNGDGSFTPIVSAPSIADPVEITASNQLGDFNGDGNLDFIFTRFLNGTFAEILIFGNGTGAFNTGMRLGSSPGLSSFTWIFKDGIARHLSNNTIADIAVLGAGDPEVGAAEAFTDCFAQLPGFNRSLSGVAGDYNGDGNLDILFSDGRIILNRGSNPDRWCAAPGGYNGASTDVGDFDGDGKADLVAVSNATTISLSLSTKTGTANTPPRITGVTTAFTTNLGIRNATFPIFGIEDTESPNSQLVISVVSAPAAILIKGFQPHGIGTLMDAIYETTCASSVTSGSIVFRVTDPGGLSATASIPVTFAPNEPPTVAYPNEVTLQAGDTLVRPTAFFDAGQVIGITVTAPDYAGRLTIAPVNENGTVTITNNGVPGRYAATVAVTDNCGSTTRTTFFFTIPAVTGCATPTFNAPQTIAAGNDPYGLASGDFNGDGKTDLAVTNFIAGTVRILLGGTTAGATYSVGALPNFVATKDVNGDGKLDLITVNRGADTTTILLGTGTGTFTKKGDYQIGNKSTGVVIGDFNSDGKQDLALPNDGLGNIAILDGNGDGSFKLPRYFYAGPSPQPGVVGDFNKDGKLDLAFPNYTTGDLALLLGNGAGGFGSPLYFGTGSGAGSEGIAVGDLDKDGNLDIVMTNSTRNVILISLGNGSGGFFQASGYQVVGSLYLSLVQIGDYNGDGKIDLAVGDYSSNRVVILKGSGTGFLTAGAFDQFNPTIINVGSHPLYLQPGDFDGNGKPDLAVTNSGSSTVSVILNGCPR